MLIKLINYDGTRTTINTCEKEIKYLLVVIVTGDEVVYTYYKDGTKEEYDSNIDGNRSINFFDDVYIVEKKDIKKFISAEINAIDAYARKEEFELCKKVS